MDAPCDYCDGTGEIEYEFSDGIETLPCRKCDGSGVHSGL